jgi:hypothetical protein
MNPGKDDIANFSHYFPFWKREPKWTPETFKDIPV